MFQKIRPLLDTYLTLDDRIIVAVSGGVDSMVLLSLLSEYLPKEHIIVAHFDHQLRGVESDEDRIFVETFCGSRDILCISRRESIGELALTEKKSIETVAREHRYRFFSELREQYGARYILTAHHLDDRIETAIFNLIRGSKLGGISAMKILSGSILRPLLGVEKSEIQSYAMSRDIPHREDSTNHCTDYHRNHIRQAILPLFETINPQYRPSLESFITYADEMKGWIDERVESWLTTQKTQHERKLENLDSGSLVYTFSSQIFSHELLFFRSEIIRYLYEKCHHGTIGLSVASITELDRYITSAHGGTIKQLGRLLLTKKSGLISVRFLSL